MKTLKKVLKMTNPSTISGSITLFCDMVGGGMRYPRKGRSGGSSRRRLRTPSTYHMSRQEREKKRASL